MDYRRIGKRAVIKDPEVLEAFQNYEKQHRAA
jgi:hypothetical protein